MAASIGGVTILPASSSKPGLAAGGTPHRRAGQVAHRPPARLDPANVRKRRRCMGNSCVNWRHYNESEGCSSFKRRKYDSISR